jgi:hypothetical protein
MPRMDNSLKEEDRVKLGLLTTFLQKLVAFLRRVTPSHYVIRKSRVDMHHDMAIMSESEGIKATNRRALAIDIYLLSWLFFQIILVTLLSFSSLDPFLECVVIILSAVRINEIVTYNVDLIVFDGLQIAKMKKKIDHRVASAARTLVNTTINYFEIVLLFHIIYIILDVNLEIDREAPLYDEHLYFSLLNQLGGWPEGFRMNNFVLLSGLQTVIGFFFTVLIIARIVAMLPNIRPMVESPYAEPDTLGNDDVTKRNL